MTTPLNRLRLVIAGATFAALAALGLPGALATNADGGAAAPAADEAPVAGEAAAVDPAVLQRGKEVWGEGAGCGGCHGWAGDGQKIGPTPPGPSLRITALDAAGLSEVIRCGRPGTAMPSHEREAYRDDRCYGVTKADLGDQVPTRGKSLSARDLEALVAYILHDMKGRGPATLAECEEFFEPGSSRCNIYKDAGG